MYLRRPRLVKVVQDVAAKYTQQKKCWLKERFVN